VTKCALYLYGEVPEWMVGGGGNTTESLENMEFMLGRRNFLVLEFTWYIGYLAVQAVL